MVWLDRQDVDCGTQFLTAMGLSGCDDNSWRYTYRCCEEGSSPPSPPTPPPTPVPPPPPSPTPPSPSPSPSPSPDPGDLPDIPDVDIWVGFWGMRETAYDIASLAMDNSGSPYTTETINKHGGGGLRFLYPAFVHFCEEEEMTGKCTLKHDYEDQWNAAVPELTQLLKDGKMIGFTAGDERVCSNGHHGTPVEDLVTMIDTIRASFPDRKKAIIHYNECGSTFGGGKDCSGAAMKDVPDCIDPKMHSHQKICITPGTTSEVCPDEKTCKKDAEYTVDWAESDDKVGCLTVYRWDDMDDLDDGKWSDLKDFWIDYASQSRPDMVQNAIVV